MTTPSAESKNFLLKRHYADINTTPYELSFRGAKVPIEPKKAYYYNRLIDLSYSVRQHTGASAGRPPKCEGTKHGTKPLEHQGGQVELEK